MIHVIDDDEAVRDSLTLLLEVEGFVVKGYRSADAFLEHPRPEPGLIVTDVHMPGLSGIDLLRQLDDRDLRLPVVVVTGRAGFADMAEAKRHGVIAFLEKPFSPEEILTAIRTALAPGGG